MKFGFAVRVHKAYPIYDAEYAERVATIRGWLVIAHATVEKTSGDTVTLHVDKEDTDIVINGKKQNQFTTGATVLLATP